MEFGYKVPSASKSGRFAAASQSVQSLRRKCECNRVWRRRPWIDRNSLFQKAGLIDDQNRVLITKRFQRVLTDNVAQRVGVPLPPAQDRLLAPGAWIPA